jgi:hypothetical protein
VKRIKKKFERISEEDLIKELDENPHLLKALDQIDNDITEVKDSCTFFLII